MSQGGNYWKEDTSPVGSDEARGLLGDWRVRQDREQRSGKEK